jgi:predicted DNA-binding protein (UPF0251 family)
MKQSTQREVLTVRGETMSEKQPVRIGNMRLFSIPEIADRFHVNRRTVWNYIRSGRLKATKFLGSWYVREADLKARFGEDSQDGE